MFSDNYPTPGVPPQPRLASDHRNEDHNARAYASAFGEGRFQPRLLFSTVVAGAISLVQLSIFRLSTREMDHRCMRPPAYSELSVESWKQLAIPRDDDGNYSRCTVRNPPEGGPSAQVVHCSEWEFDLSEYGNSVVSEWSLVCHRSYLKDIAASVNFVTAVVALLVIGAAADRIGRKTVTVVHFVAPLRTLVCSGLARDFRTFAATQAAVTATSRSYFVLYVILYEVTSPSRRILYCTAVVAFTTTFAPVFVFLVDSFKISWYWSLLIVAALSSVLLATFYVLEESPVWLLETRYTEQSERVVVKAANVNASSLSLRAATVQEAATEHGAKSAFHNEGTCRELEFRTWSKEVFSAPRVYTGRHQRRSWPLYRRAMHPRQQLRACGNSIGLIPLFLVVLTFLQKGRFLKEAVVACTLVRATACASLFLHFSGELTLLGSVLMVIVRLSINAAAVIAFYLSTSLYPTPSRCFGLGTCYAFAVIGNMGDFYFFSSVLANHEDYGFGIMPLLLALASIAI
ncbi:hypothetical protein HPB48_000692 [Haemaphysalis longicornis]|uniref:Uncharacterized protein n=1 Tax=Haemaphysalis longicornis TaxID=44386 RepID=A0A9J6H4A4_HAELO|nr:hypothetical protein HPB48_000692 [Haemaphysalis longicornis]